jgi:hypothetical protein
LARDGAAAAKSIAAEPTIEVTASSPARIHFVITESLSGQFPPSVANQPGRQKQLMRGTITVPLGRYSCT